MNQEQQIRAAALQILATQYKDDIWAYEEPGATNVFDINYIPELKWIESYIGNGALGVDLKPEPMETNA
jgi:hypothetical protein